MHKYQTHKLTTKEALISLHSIRDYDYRHRKVTPQNGFQVLTFVMLIAEAGVQEGDTRQNSCWWIKTREKSGKHRSICRKEMVQKTEQGCRLPFKGVRGTDGKSSQLSPNPTFKTQREGISSQSHSGLCSLGVMSLWIGFYFSPDHMVRISALVTHKKRFSLAQGQCAPSTNTQLALCR